MKKQVTEHELQDRRAIMGFASLPLMLVFATMFTIPLVFLAGFMGAQGVEGVSIAGAVILTALAELVVLAIGLKWTKGFANLKETLLLGKPKLKHLLFGLGVGVVAFGGLQLIAMGFGALGMPIESSNTSMSVTDTVGFERFLVLGLLVPFIIPFIEELFFRGYILGLFKKTRGRLSAPWVGILVSAVFFGLVHFQGFASFTDLFLLVWIGIIGFAYALITSKTGTIWPAVAAHMAYNGITIVFALLGQA